MLSGDLALVNSHIEACLAKNKPKPASQPAAPVPAAKSISAEENNEESVPDVVVFEDGPVRSSVQVQVPAEAEGESDKAAHPFGAAQYTEVDLLEGSGSLSSGSLCCFPSP